MSYTVFVSNRNGKHYYALVEDGKLLEYEVRSGSADCIPGTVINGCVQEVSKSLEAAFVNIGPYKQAFLPLDGRDLSAVKSGMEFPVQIKKAPIDEKGAQVSDRIELAGQFLVLIGGEQRYGVSSKIVDVAERARLKGLVETLSAGKGFCYIARTESAAVSEAFIRSEAEALEQQYLHILKSARFSAVGTVLYQPATVDSEWFVRYTPERVVFDALEDKLAFEKAHPDATCEISLYQDTHLAMEDVYKISSQLTKAIQKTLSLEGGGTVVIEETTALCAIDVNSGKGIAPKKEDAVFNVNLKAAALIMDQLRLRNIGGVVMIDFINMREEAHRAALIGFLQEKSRSDSAQIKIYGFTKLGLLEMARERKGLSLSRKLTD